MSGISQAVLQPIAAYICPKCHGQLKKADDAYTCVVCAAQYPVADGIPDFCPETNLYWGELSADQMREVVACAQQSGYEKAAEVARRYDPTLGDYLLNRYRADWVFHCAPLSRWETCLDIGSGWGTVSRALLKYGLKVWSLEIMRERLAFQEAFKRQEKLDGLTLLRGTAIRLPFPDHSFDLVSANGVLQWIGLADHSRPVGDLQRDFLRECRRVLRPDGVLFLGLRNRFGFRRLMGGKDHSGLRFTSVMPRKMADIVVRRFRRTGGKFSRRFQMPNDWRDYRTYTYSIHAYENLLESCGFKQVESFWAYPGNNMPQAMGRTKEPRSLKAFLDYTRQTFDRRASVSIVTRAILGFRFVTAPPAIARLLLRASDSLVVFARPAGSDARSTMDSVVGPYAFCFGGSNKIVWWNVGRNGGSKEVVKIGRFPSDERTIQADEEQTARFNKIDISTEVHGPWTAYREPLLDARRMDSLSERENLAAVSVLLDLQAKTRKDFWQPDNLDQDIAGHLAAFCDLAPDAALRQLAEQDCERLSDALRAVRLPVVMEHGDFAWDNILMGAEGQIYLIDWSHMREIGEPLFDFSILSYNHWIKRTEVTANNGNKHSVAAPAAKPMIAAFTASTRIAPGVIYAYFPYSLIRKINRTHPLYRQALIEQFRSRRFPQPDREASSGVAVA